MPKEKINEDFSSKIETIITPEIQNSVGNEDIRQILECSNQYPVSNVKLDTNKYLIFGRNKYFTRSFAETFKIYRDFNFNNTCPNGIYTWILIELNDIINNGYVFICARAINNLEIHAKHEYILNKLLRFMYNTSEYDLINLKIIYPI